MITWDNLNKIKQIQVLTNEIMKWDKKDLEYFVVALVGLNIRDLSRSDSDVDFVLLGSAHQVLIN